MFCKSVLSLGSDDSIIVWPLFSCDIINLDLTLGKPNLRRSDSDAVYGHYFIKLKCLVDRFCNLRRFLHFPISKYLRFQRQGLKNNPLMGTETFCKNKKILQRKRCRLKNNPLMGTETPFTALSGFLNLGYYVKLNNPLMGTETANKCSYIPAGFTR